MSKRKAIYTLTACVIAALFLTGVLIVGLKTDHFGLAALKREAEGGGGNTSGYRYGYRWDPEENPVRGLDVEWVNGTVELRTSNARLIRITEKSDGRDLRENEKLKLTYSGGTLRIKWNNQFLNLAIFDNTRKDLIVDVPQSLMEGTLTSLKCANTSGDIRLGEGFRAETLELSSTSGSLTVPGFDGESAKLTTVSGDITAENLTLTETLEMDTVSGWVRLAEVTAQEAKLNTVSGEVSLAGSVARIDGDAVSGGLDLLLDRCPEEADLDAVSGSLTLSLPESSDFQVRYDTVSGRFTSDFELDGGGAKSDTLVYGQGGSKLAFDTTSGDIALRKTAARSGGVPAAPDAPAAP